MVLPTAPVIDRRVPRVLLALAILLLLAACSGGDDAPAIEASPTATSTPAVGPLTTHSAEQDDQAPATPAPAAQDQADTDADLEPALAESHVDGPVVVLDPGHGGDDIGAAANGVVEKESNLDIAFRVEALLEDAGVHVVLTRREDVRVGGSDLTGFPRNRADRQARVDIANEAGADAFVSIHSNGLGDTSVRGLETYYNEDRSFAARNYLLARALHDGVLNEAAAIGHSLVDRGVRDDGCIYLHRGNCWPMFVLGPERPAMSTSFGSRPPTRATEMPGTLVELLFISNPADARLLQDDAVRDAMARGIAGGVLDFLAEEGVWDPATAE